MAAGLPLPGKVYAHGWWMFGNRKMSKSLGNAVDPDFLAGKYGADALRFGLSSSSVMGRDLQISEGNFESARNFANKIWNASRFVMMNLEGYEYQPLDKEPLELMNAWIIDEYNKTVKEISSALEEYDISKASRLAYDFIWSKYCDWYLELAKTRFYGEGIDKKKRLAAQNVLVEILEGTLKLLHPVMPFITEEIWQRLKEITGKKGCDSIMISPWPEPLKIKIDKQSVRKMHLIIDMVSKIRNIRSEFNVPPAEILKEVNIYGDSIYAEILRDRECLGSLWRLARIDIKRISYSTMPPDRPEKGSAMALLEEGYVHVPLVGLIDVGKEAKRLEKEIQNINNELERINGKLDNRQFLANAPRDVVEDAKRRKKEGEEKRKKLRDNLDSLK